MNPPAPEPDPAVPRPIEEIRAEEAPDVGHDRGVAGRVKAVTAIVHSHPAELEAAGVPARNRLLFQHGDLRPVEMAQPIGPANPGRTGPENHHPGSQNPAHWALPPRDWFPARHPAPKATTSPTKTSPSAAIRIGLSML